MNTEEKNNVCVKVSDIEWDTEDNGEHLSAEELELPDEVSVALTEIDPNGEMKKEEVADAIIDLLTDRFGYCIVGADVEIA